MKDFYRAKNFLCCVDWDVDDYLRDDENGTIVSGEYIEIWDEEDVEVARKHLCWDELTIKQHLVVAQ